MDQTWFYILILGIFFIGYTVYTNRKSDKLMDSDNYIRLVFFAMTVIFGILAIYSRQTGYLYGKRLMVAVSVTAIGSAIIILSGIKFNTTTKNYVPLQNKQEKNTQRIIYGAITVTLLIFLSVIAYMYQDQTIYLKNLLLKAF